MIIKVGGAWAPGPNRSLRLCLSVCLSQTTTRALVTAASTTRRANRCLADTRAHHVLTDSPDSTANEVRIHPAVPSICRVMSRCSTHFTPATAVKFSWNPKESISIFHEIQWKFSLLYLIINWSAVWHNVFSYGAQNLSVLSFKPVTIISWSVFRIELL